MTQKMSLRNGALVVAMLTAVTTVTIAQGAAGWRERTIVPIASGEWAGPRLADGQPDVQGHWSNTIGNHNNFTRPQGGDDGAPGARARDGNQANRAPSRVSDPPDGQVPYQPWARSQTAGVRGAPRRPDASRVRRAAGALRAGRPDQVVHVARLRDPAIPGLRALPVRLGNTDRPSRRQAAPGRERQAVERRLARPLGRQHAGRGRRQQQLEVAGSAGPASSSARTPRFASASSSTAPASDSTTRPSTPTRPCSRGRSR